MFPTLGGPTGYLKHHQDLHVRSRIESDKTSATSTESTTMHRPRLVMRDPSIVERSGLRPKVELKHLWEYVCSSDPISNSDSNSDKDYIPQSSDIISKTSKTPAWATSVPLPGKASSKIVGSTASSQDLLGDDDQHVLDENTRHPPLGQSLVVGSSGIVSEEPKVIDWSDAGAKRTFERTLKELMENWGGVALAHRGTCVFAFQNRSPPDLIDPLDPQSLEIMPLVYYIGDYKTTFAEAAARFGSEVGRYRGEEGGGLVGRKQHGLIEASYPCSHSHCMIHMVYELVSIKKNRESCFIKAQQARFRNSPIPELCSQHNPPCLLQHASLSTIEVKFIQLNIRSQTNGTYRPLPIHRPLGWPYSTFETELPLRWDNGSRAMIQDLTHLVSKIPSESTSQR
ncbi:MAG: hypothetical protein Q9198_005080 [Flavoplaca austrocitrina]